MAYPITPSFDVVFKKPILFHLEKNSRRRAIKTVIKEVRKAIPKLCKVIPIKSTLHTFVKVCETQKSNCVTGRKNL